MAVRLTVGARDNEHLGVAVSLGELMLMDLYRAGDPPDPAGLIPVHASDHTLVLEDGEQVLWRGQAEHGRGDRTDPARNARDGFTRKVWSCGSSLDVTITNRRVVYRVDKLAKLELGTGYVVAGLTGILAQKALTSVAMRNMTGAGHVRHRWMLGVASSADKKCTTLVMYLIEPARTYFRVSLTFRGQHAELAPYLAGVAADDRLEACAPYAQEDPEKIDGLRRQSDLPTTRQGLWGEDYALGLCFCPGGADLPLTIQIDRSKKERRELADKELATLASAIEDSGNGVRSSGTALHFDLHGYAYVLPTWWESVQTVDVSGCENISALDSLVAEHYGLPSAGNQYWREAVKAHVIWSAGKWYLPIAAGQWYAAGGFPQQAALLSADLADYIVTVDDDHKLRKLVTYLDAALSMEAARHLYSVDCFWAAYTFAARANSHFRVGKTDAVNTMVADAEPLMRKLKPQLQSSV